MVSTFTPQRNLEKPAHNDDIDTWDVPVNRNSNLLDSAFGGVTPINVTAASGTIVLSNDTATPPSYISPIFKLSGALTANVNYQFPTGIGGNYTVYNNTTGAFAVTFSSGGLGATVAVPQGASTLISVDGVNVLLAQTMATVAADKQVIYNRLGVLSGSAGLTFDYSTNTLRTDTIWANTALYALGSATGYVALKAPANSPGIVYTMPGVDGANGQFLTTNGAGTLNWTTLTSGVSSWSAGTTGLTPNSATTGNVTLGGTLVIGNGGTGNTIGSVSVINGIPTNFNAAPQPATITSLLGQDANGQLYKYTLGACANFGIITSGNIGAQSVANANTSVNLSGGSVNATTITATGNITAFVSDDRLKNRCGDIEGALDKLCSLPIFYYEMNDLALSMGLPPGRRIGTSAQSMMKVLPELMRPAPINSQYLTYQDQQLLPVVIAAIQELRWELHEVRQGR